MGSFDPISYINDPRWQESRLGLERMRALLERMGRPQDELRFVHVAGTNGKGSTCAYIGEALRAAGYRVGMFESPAVLSFAESICVDGHAISEGDLSACVLRVREAADQMTDAEGGHPTAYELTWAAALDHFVRSGCEIVVAEVGMGGRLDATNVIERPDVCVITRIGIDHSAFLGNTIEQIAAEKAGIVKHRCDVVAWPNDDSGALHVIEQRASEMEAKVTVPSFAELEVGPIEGSLRRFRYKGREYSTKMLGSYQPYNAALALEALLRLERHGWNVPYEAVCAGFARAFQPGRFEVIPKVGSRPVMVVDGGHNPQGAQALVDSLADAFPGRQVTFVMTVLADKDYPSMVELVAPLAAHVVCFEPPNQRALSAESLARAVRGAMQGGGQVVAAGSFEDAVDRAVGLAGPDGVVCIFGSLYSVAGFIRSIRGEGAA